MTTEEKQTINDEYDAAVRAVANARLDVAAVASVIVEKYPPGRSAPAFALDMLRPKVAALVAAKAVHDEVYKRRFGAR